MKKKHTYKIKQYFNEEIKSNYTNDKNWKWKWFFLNKYRFLFLYRVYYVMYRCEKIPKFIPLLLNERLKRKYGPDIDLRAEIDIGLQVGHVTFPFIIRPEAFIGKNFHIMQGVTIGIKSAKDHLGYISIGNNVSVFSNSIILGNLDIGNNVTIAAGSFIDKNITDNSVIIQKRK